jgi:hypothetical protein
MPRPKEHLMNRLQRIFSVLIVPFGLALGLAGCTYYEMAPGVYATTPPNTFERSWSAAIGALGDEGVLVVQQDRAAGYARGTLAGATVTAELRSQADGSVRVQFNTKDAADPSLNDRIVRSYNRRMGR